MFFFYPGAEQTGTERWRQYIQELGLQDVIDRMTERGHKCEWVTEVYGPSHGAEFHKGGGKFHPSRCPCYEGYWWAGGFGAVQCSNAPDGELLPGAVYERMCRKDPTVCPFSRGQNRNERST